MSQITLPNQSVTGANLWSQVEDNDQAIVDVVNGDIDASNLADDAVTTPKIDDAAVTTSKLAGDAVDGTKLADDAVDTEHIADDAVEAAQIADGAVTAAKIPDGSLTPAKLALTVASDTTNGSGSVNSTGGTTIPNFSVTLAAGTWLITAQLNFDVNNAIQCEAVFFNNSIPSKFGQEALFEGEGRASYSIPVSLTTIATFTDPIGTSVGVFYGSGAGGSVDISVATNSCEIRAVRLG